METALRKNNKKGFTLVELVIVIAVLAILAAIAIPTVTSVIDTANKNVDLSNAQTVELALKTADAEIQAGTAPTGVAESSKVTDVLAKYGVNIDNFPTGKTATFQYKSGKVVLTGGTAFDTNTTLGNFMGRSTT